MNSSDPEVEHSVEPNVAVQKVGVLARIATFLFGNDVFISYSRSDAAPYALALASELTKQKLTCYWVDTKGAVKSWRVETGQMFARIPVGDVGIDQNVVSTPDGRLVTYRDGRIIFWDLNITSWISRACQVANRSLTSHERDEYSVQLQGNDLCKN